MFDYNYIHPRFIFIPCPGMTPDGLRAQYLIPNLMPKCECLSIHSFLPLGPRHHAIPRNQRKQSLCRTEANCRPQTSLPNLLKKSSPIALDPSPNQAHKSVLLLYQFLVLTVSYRVFRAYDIRYSHRFHQHTVSIIGLVTITFA
jgi:hypothetical protein